MCTYASAELAWRRAYRAAIPWEITESWEKRKQESRQISYSVKRTVRYYNNVTLNSIQLRTKTISVIG